MYLKEETEIQSKLLIFFESSSPSKKDFRISDLKKISHGWENEIYSFRAEYKESDALTEKGEKGEKSEGLILRIYPGSDAAMKSAIEFNVMQQLYEVGYPVPKVLIRGSDNSVFDKPFVIMEKIDGELMGKVIDESPYDKKLELLALFLRMLIDLHKLDWRPFVHIFQVFSDRDPSISPIDLIKGKLSKAQELFHSFHKFEFDPVFDWLKRGISEVRWGRLSLIHWDYHPWNVILRDDGKAFVIDWGGVEISDFRLDLAWTLLLMSNYGNPEVRDIVLNEYERISGGKVEDIEYFEVVACLRRLFSISVSLSDGAGKLGMRPGAEVIMRGNLNHIKNVYELLCNRTNIQIPEVERLL